MLKKRLMSVFLCLCMVAGMLPAMTTTAQATSKTADDAIAWANSQVGHSVGRDDGSGHYQCVEFIQAYYQWLGVGAVSGNGAHYATNDLPSGWTRTAGGIPQKGDILVYSGDPGHVAIYESDNVLYDQDGNVKGAVVKKEEKNYRTYIPNYWGCIHPNFTPAHYADTQDLGDDFYAYITNPQSGCNLENRSNNVQLASVNRSDPRQLWHFTRQDETSYKIINMYDGRCLDTDGASATSGVWVLPYNGNELQKWRFYGTSNAGPFYVAPYRHNSDHAYVLDVANANFTAGANIQLCPNWYKENGYFGQPAQIFQVNKVSEDEVKSLLAHNAGSDFYSRISFNGAYLQVVDGANSQSFDVRTTQVFENDPRQIWHFVRQSDGSYKITNEYTNLILSIFGSDASDRANIWVASDVDRTAQRWYLIYSPGDSTYRITSAHKYPSELYSLDIDADDGSNAQIYHQNESANQKFSISGIPYTKPSAPAAPANIQVNATSSGTTITWDAVPTAGAYDSRNYSIYLANTKNERFIPTTIVDDNRYVSDVILPDGEYFVAVRAYNTKYYRLISDVGVYEFSVTPESVTHTITVNATEGGTASGGGTYSDGINVTVSTTASEGYDFKGWSENGTIVSTNASYTFEAKSDRTLTATFEKKQTPAPVTHTVSVSADPAEGGTVTGSGTYQDNASVTVTATASTGYTFKNWTENGSEVSSNASYTFNIAADRTLVAAFEKDPDEPDPPTPVTTYTVNINASPAAGGTVSGGGTYQSGASATVRAVANSGYTFKGWTKGDTQISTDASYTFSVTEDTSLTAVFEADIPAPTPTYRISVSAMTGGTVSGGGTYQSGASVTVTATPSNNYQFVEWRESGNQVSTSASYMFSATTNRTLMAVFERTETPPTPSYTVNVSADPAASGSVSGGGSFQRGASATISATPNDGYRFVCWRENGEAVSFNSSYTFSVSGNTTLTAVFEANTPTPSTSYRVSVQASPAEGGAVTGGDTYQSGDTVTIAATPNSGYQFKEWQLDGRQISTTASYTFTASADQAFTAIFERVEQPPVKTYLVSLSANPSTGGSVNGGGTFAENSTITITATANSNYRFTGWSENGSQISTSASYTFTISADRTLVAGFAYTGGSTVTPGGNPGGHPSSGTTGNTSPSQPSLPVSTSGANSSMTTTASPNATIRGDTATSVITSAIVQEIIKQATANNSGEVVIAPVVRTDVAKTEITLPATVLSEIEQKTNAGLIVSTPHADVSFQNSGLSSLSNRQDVVVSTERTGNALELSITVGGQPVECVPGGLTLTAPVDHSTPGTVAVVIYEDGSREVIRKSVADGNSITIPLDGSAKVEIIDNAKAYTDVSTDSWAANAVAFASGHELFSGTSSDTFSPDLPMTRGMLAMVLHNLENNPAQPITEMFSDVTPDAWYSEAVAWAAARGIVSGYGNGLFGPNDHITREQLAVMLWRYAGEPAATNKELHFNDVDEASGYALDALCWATENGIVNGKGGGILDPRGQATRAQVAQMLMNYLKK